jgi:hypothetical protein
MQTGQEAAPRREQKARSRLGASAARLSPGLQLAALVLLFFAGVWGTYVNGINGWVILARVSLVAAVAAFLLIDRPDWRASGFRLGNMREPWNRTLLIAVAVPLAVLIGAAAAGHPIVPLTTRSVSESIVSGLIQQAVILGYFFRLWERALGRSIPAAIANSALFGVIHIPDFALVLLAGLGGFILHLFFLRGRNVYVIGLVHGICSIVLLPALLSQGLMQTAKIGPSELLPFSRRILRESGPDSRVAVCSQFVAPDVFRDSFNRPVARIFRGLNDPGAMRQRLADFLARDERVYCVITERELRELMPPGAQARVHRLAEGWVWRKRGPERDRLFERSILELFLERVVLISNRLSSG